jgi:DNA-binding transcriptional regulator YiaG
MRESPMVTATLQVLSLPESIKHILASERITRSQLASELHVTRHSLWEWESGKSLPREPVICVALLLRAGRLKNVN